MLLLLLLFVLTLSSFTVELSSALPPFSSIHPHHEAAVPAILVLILFCLKNVLCSAAPTTASFLAYHTSGAAYSILVLIISC